MKSELAFVKWDITKDRMVSESEMVSDKEIHNLMTNLKVIRRKKMFESFQLGKRN